MELSMLKRKLTALTKSESEYVSSSLSCLADLYMLSIALHVPNLGTRAAWMVVHHQCIPPGIKCDAASMLAQKFEGGPSSFVCTLLSASVLRWSFDPAVVYG